MFLFLLNYSSTFGGKHSWLSVVYCEITCQNNSFGRTMTNLSSDLCFDGFLQLSYQLSHPNWQWRGVVDMSSPTILRGGTSDCVRLAMSPHHPATPLHRCRLELLCCPRTGHITEPHCCTGWRFFISMNTHTAVYFDSIPRTPSCRHKHSPGHQMCIHSQLKMDQRRCREGGKYWRVVWPLLKVTPYLLNRTVRLQMIDESAYGCCWTH